MRRQANLAGRQSSRSTTPTPSTSFTWNTQAFWIVLIGGIVGGILQEATEGIPSLLGTLIMLIVAIFNIISLNKLAKAFGHGVGFTIGLFFLNPIFMLILGFSGDEYIGPQ